VARRADRDRDAQALRLHVCGLDYRAIGERLGCSHAAAHRAVQRALADYVNRPRDEAIQLAVVELDHARREVWRVLSAGDVGPRSRVEAVRTLVQINTEYRKLLGLDAPKRQEITVISESTVDAEIARLEGQLSDRARQMDLTEAELDALLNQEGDL
jgi:hypothetical protein